MMVTSLLLVVAMNGVLTNSCAGGQSRTIQTKYRHHQGIYQNIHLVHDRGPQTIEVLTPTLRDTYSSIREMASRRGQGDYTVLSGGAFLTVDS